MSQCFRLFGVKRNGYYKASKRLIKDETALILAIKACFNQHKRSYGRRRLKVALFEELAEMAENIEVVAYLESL